MIMDGRATAAAIKSELAQRVRTLRGQGTMPGLGIILVGSDPASRIYVDGKHRDCAEIGIRSIRVELPLEATTEQVLEAVQQLNENPECSGFIVQLPLPAQCDTDLILAAVSPSKDVDGLHPINIGRLAAQSVGPLPALVACTPLGIVELGRRYGLDWRGADVCMVGQGRTVGRPFSLLASHEAVGATVTSCHVGTHNLAEHTRRADVVVAAAGVARLITGDMVKPGATVFDVGVTRETGPDGTGRIVGDVAEEVAQVAARISPNPGGVGPMTRAMLLRNVVQTVAERVNFADRNG